MNADHLSYARATTVSLIGLGIQAVLAAVVLIYGILGSDSAAVTASLAMMLGLVIWVALALVFHQHKLERLEELEAESYRASSAAQSSVFEEAGADLRQKATRLQWMHKWFLPCVSVLMAFAFLGVGFLRFTVARAKLSPDKAVDLPVQAGWAIAIGIGVAVIGFIFARFVAGMTKQKVWALLHAGSATAIACSLMGISIAIAHGLQGVLGNEWVLRSLDSAIAGFMVLLGAEMLLNFVLNLYRPRKAGEYQRPGFDSRTLAFIAAPDRLAESVSEAINYQFGFNVSSTWFYQLLARSVLSLAVLGGLTMWLMSIFTVVAPFERGLLLRNGNLVREVSPGLVVDLPWPMSRVQRFSAAAVNEIQVGTPPPSQEGPILWTNDHTIGEKYLLVQPSGVRIESENRSGDLNLLAIEIPIHYVVSDLKKYILLAADGPAGKTDQPRRDLLTALASSATIEYVATLGVDEVLGPGRSEMTKALAEAVQREFDRMDAGVRVIFCGVAGAHPEKSVAPSYEEVVGADVRRLAAVERAEADAIRTLATVVGEVERARQIISELDALDGMKRGQSAGASRAEITEQEQKVNEMVVSAGGEAAVLISEARADRWQKHLGARSRSASSAGQIASYRAAPLPYKFGRYLQALRTMARGARVWIVPAQVRVIMNNEEIEAGAALLEPDAPANQ